VTHLISDNSVQGAESVKAIQRKLELVVSTGLLLGTSSDLQTITQATTDAGLQLCGAQYGVCFYNVTNALGENRLLHTLSGLSGNEPEHFAGFAMRWNARLFDGTGIVRSGDITRDQRHARNAPYKLPVRSYLAVPVRASSGELLGGLFYGHEQTDVFTQEAEELVATIAAQAAIAIENVCLREQLTRQIQDLGEAERLRHETAKHIAELAAIVESSDDAIISKDLTGCITSWNQSAARILGYAEEEIVGRSILTLIPKELHCEEKVILEKISRGERVDHYETTRMTKSGERLDVSLSISPIRDASGTIVGASKILRDISTRKKLEKSILQAEKIAASGRMAATLAHEVNNPLEAVMNLLYLARSNASHAEQVEAYLRSAENEVNRVSHIARQTLGFYREHTSEVRVAVSELMRDAVKIYEPKCKSAGICIKVNLASTLELVLRRGEMMQVISNLVANAIYAMPSGGTVWLSAEDAGTPEQAGVLLSIRDNGVGIQDEHLPRIFEPFFTTRGSVGTGIGLFVARQFVESHGGRIEVSSSVADDSHGTTFSIFLPLNNPYTTGEDRRRL
jgi:PAS domain S-box-containing protein